MTDDRDPRIHDLLERHTPAQEGAPDWARVHGRRPMRRLIRPAMAVAGVAMLVALVGAMFLVAPSGADRSATTPFAERAEVGLAIRMRVTPVSATRLGLNETAARAAAALVARARRAGIAAEANTLADGTIDAWIPAARKSSDLGNLVGMDAFAVFDLTGNVLARSRNPQVVLDAAQRLGPRDRFSRFYVVGAVTPPAVYGPWEARDREAADPSARYVPAGYAVIRTVADEWVLVPDAPLLATEDIASVSTDGDRGEVRLTPGGAGRWRSVDAVPEDGGLELVSWSESGTGKAVGSIAAVGAEPLLVIPADPLSASEAFEGAGADAATAIPAMLRITEERRTGPAERRRGVPAAQPPAGIEDYFDLPSPALRRDTILRVLTLPAKGGSTPAVIWSVLDATGRELVIVQDARGGTALAEACELTAEHPDIRTCGGEAGVYAYGRVSDRVARLDQGDAVVENGWFFARFPRSSPGPVPFRALDADGDELGRVDQDAFP